MDAGKSKQRAVGILLVLGSILVLMAMWETPTGLSAHGKQGGE